MAHECFCGCQFGTLQSLHNHINSKGHQFKCCCTRMFKNQASLKQHQVDYHNSRSKSFVQHPACKEQTPVSTCNHVEGPNRCSLCCKVYANYDGLRAHMEAKHSSCPTCYQHFLSSKQRDGHKRATGHCYCDEHDESFDCTAGFDAHKNDLNHVSSYECLDCDRPFGTQRGLDHHLESAGHAAVALTALERINESQSEAAAKARAEAQEEASLRCEECDRDFHTIVGFKHHKTSLKHKPLSDLKCPLSSKCKKRFPSPSSLLLHLESGGCKSGMNRLKLNALIHTHDTGRHITDLQNAANVVATATTTGSSLSTSNLPARLCDMSISGRNSAVQTPAIEDIDDDGSRIGKSNRMPFFTPSATTSHSWSSSSSVDGVIPSLATSQNAWSFVTGAFTSAPTSLGGSSVRAIQYDTRTEDWPCIIHGCSKRFKKQKSLLDHLHSPFHAPKLFRCPTKLVLPGGGEHEVLFKTLSGFAQHIESGACAGGEDTIGFVAGLFEAKIQELSGQLVKLLKAAT